MSARGPAVSLSNLCLCLVIASGIGAANGLSAFAQGGSLPPPPLPGAGDPSAGGAPATLPGPGDIAPPAAPVNAADMQVVPGAAEQQRKALLARILEAKNQGIGISTYQMAFDSLEESVKGGADEAAVTKRIISLNTSLDDQFKRGAILKTQRAAPPVAASESSMPIGNAGSSPSSFKNTDTAALIQKLQSKFGGGIPDAYKSKLPPSMQGQNPSDLLKNPQIQDLLKGVK